MAKIISIDYEEGEETQEQTFVTSGPNTTNIRPSHSVLRSLDDDKIKIYVFAFAVIFCFERNGSQITVTML
jgi:hypothetical protein